MCSSGEDQPKTMEAGKSREKTKHRQMKLIHPKVLLATLSANRKESFAVVDCRFLYEYDGGHIRGAVNIYTRRKLRTFWEEQKKVLENVRIHSIIFHCEFSRVRGPTMYKYLLELIGEGRPHTKLQVGVLKGGYKTFYQEALQSGNVQCLGGSQGYTRMMDPPQHLDVDALHLELDSAAHLASFLKVKEDIERRNLEDKDVPKDLSSRHAEALTTSHNAPEHLATPQCTDQPSHSAPCADTSSTVPCGEGHFDISESTEEIPTSLLCTEDHINMRVSQRSEETSSTVQCTEKISSTSQRTEKNSSTAQCTKNSSTAQCTDNSSTAQCTENSSTAQSTEKSSTVPCTDKSSTAQSTEKNSSKALCTGKNSSTSQRTEEHFSMSQCADETSFTSQGRENSSTALSPKDYSSTAQDTDDSFLVQCPLE